MKYVAIIFITIGAAILGQIWTSNSIYMPKLDPWPTVKGRVLETKVLTVSEDEETGQSIFKPVVRYEFKYRGRVFREKRIFPKEKQFHSLKKAKQFLTRFPLEKEIDVYLNTDMSKSPRSVLIWEFPDALNPMVGIAVACFVSGLIALLIVVGRFVANTRST